ncbi:MAG: hypothetical protein LC114_16325 [Bryobacterales bacterium]|nr:hypothetical protein [Bryobacterales bacterium]
MIIGYPLMLAAAVASWAFATPQDITVVRGSRHDIGLTAIASSGEVFIAARELLVDITFQGGTSGKGKLHVVFDASTKCFLQSIFWVSNGKYPVHSWFENIAQTGRFVVSDDRLVLITLQNRLAPFIAILESSPEKATDLDDAEVRSVRWYRDHLSVLEARTYTLESFGYFAARVAIGIPNGFFDSDLSTDPRGYLPVKFVDVARINDTQWTVTLESTENPSNHRRLQVPIYKRPDNNSRGRSARWMRSFPSGAK